MDDKLDSVGKIDMRPTIVLADGDLTDPVRTLLFRISFFEMITIARGIESKESAESWSSVKKAAWALTTTPIL